MNQTGARSTSFIGNVNKIWSKLQKFIISERLLPKPLENTFQLTQDYEVDRTYLKAFDPIKFPEYVD